MAEARLKPAWRLDQQSARALALGTHDNPFAVLGPHDTRDGCIIRAFLPSATKVDVLRRSDGAVLATLEQASEAGLFEGFVCERAPYRLRIAWPDAVQETEDPYSFGLLLGDLDLHLFNEGRHFELACCLGAQRLTIDGVNGVRFAVWAPNASRVAVVGDFNSWDRRRHPMRVRHGAGIWELFIPRVAPGSRYKYDIAGPGGIEVAWKADPVAARPSRPPALHLSFRSRTITAGATKLGCDPAANARRQTRRYPSTNCISARGSTRGSLPRRVRHGISLPIAWCLI